MKGKIMEGNSGKLTHVLESQQFSAQLLKEIFSLAKEMEFVVTYCNKNDRKSKSLENKRMMALFYEPSTRTRLSFEMAMSYLGGQFFSTENAKEFSSAVKGETIEDTIRVICRYHPNVIVLRHYEEGSAQKAAQVSSVPIINAGDGAGQHHTQALLDLYTIQKKFGRINGFTIAMVGDLANGRTVRSLCYLLGKFEGTKIYFVSPLSLRMRSDIKDYLRKRNVQFCEVTDIRSIAHEVDIVYQTRIQKERGSSVDDLDHDAGFFIIDKTVLQVMHKHAIIMHPLPRNHEISLEVDQDPRAIYFEQAENGLYIRMALLRMIMGPELVWSEYSP